MSRVTAYQFTTEDRNDDRIAMMKKVIATTNKIAREDFRNGYSNNVSLYRVRLMPRGPRVEAAWGDYRSRRAYDSYLPMRHARHFDVYIHRDTSAEYQLKREKETGLTPGQLRRLDKEEHELIIAKMEMHQRLRDAGIYLDDENNYVSWDRKIEQLRDRGYPESIIERLM